MKKALQLNKSHCIRQNKQTFLTVKDHKLLLMHLEKK